MIIRKATINDYDGIHHIHRQVHELHVKARPDHYRMNEITLDQDYYCSLISADDKLVLVAEEDSSITAFAFIAFRPSKDIPIKVKHVTVFIEAIGVKREDRGQGIGKALFEEIKNIAIDRDAHSVELGVWEFNEDAIHFYEVMGMNTKVITMEMRL